MNTGQSDSIFSKYVNVRVMLSIMLSVILSAVVDLLLTDPPKIDYVMQILPVVYVIFIMYLIIYFVESIPAIGTWYIQNIVSPMKPVGGK